MKRVISSLALLLAFSGPALARDGLEAFIEDVNVRAQVDLPGFYATVGAQFGVPASEVQVIQRSVSEPGVAFMIFQLSQMSGKPVDRVLRVYEHGTGVGKGWGMIAKELGIKPGSSDFHALKRGDLVYGEQGPARMNARGGKPGHGAHGQGRHGEN
ncbi:hypothetical protein G3574_18395 [Noviherbaspirillum sp. 17J57-3]|uniref:Uncharacterized protein n=2 Tax=Noviherbaspirillum galbum TaxID=2709383 RepID=A0A6B3SRA7_9BURK|nr:hypothetical protein [Noviherbaspirillum galbum]